MPEDQCISLTQLFTGLQNKLKTDLDLARATIPHMGDMGTASENKWRETLSRYLPSRYQVEKAIVVDSNGRCSDSIDIVIFDRQYTNLLFSHGEQLFVPAESVYAILEAKQSLSRENLIYAGNKARSVRSLYRSSVPVSHVQGTAAPKPPIPILAGLICLDSDWTPPYGDPFGRVMAEMGQDDLGRVDLGCSVYHGSFETTWAEGVPDSKMSSSESSLSFFLLRLMKRLQQVGTVAAIDFDAYGQWLT